LQVSRRLPSLSQVSRAIRFRNQIVDREVHLFIVRRLKRPENPVPNEGTSEESSAHTMLEAKTLDSMAMATGSSRSLA
jgi:hypothetical protein